MNREERDRMVERVLKEALAPQAIEPRAGLEQRILANLRAQPEPRPWRRWMWAPAAAVVLLVIALRPTRPAQPTQAPVAVQHPPAEVASKQPAPPVVAAQGPVVRKRTAPPATTMVKAAPPVPREPVFAPARLTPAESALVAMLRSNPGEAQVVVERQEQVRQEAAEFMEQAMKPR